METFPDDVNSEVKINTDTDSTSPQFPPISRPSTGGTKDLKETLACFGVDMYNLGSRLVKLDNCSDTTHSSQAKSSNDEECHTESMRDSYLQELKKEFSLLECNFKVLSEKVDKLEGGSISAFFSTPRKRNWSGSSLGSQSQDSMLTPVKKFNVGSNLFPEDSGSQSETISSPTKWHEFTASDRKEMVKFILENRKLGHLGVESPLWKTMLEAVFNNRNHTYKSLENHYRRKIKPNLGAFNLTKDEMKKFDKDYTE